MPEGLDKVTEADGQPPRPRFRATISRGQVSITEWAPWLVRDLPGGETDESEGPGFAIADLTPVGEEEQELVVRVQLHKHDRREAECRLIDWSSHVGYSRVWLPTRVVEIPPCAEQIGVATVRCPTCATVWRDASPEFWLAVRDRKLFPLWCRICGSEMPQWEVSGRSPEPIGADAAGAEERSGGYAELP
jgi:hypothetical protein